jgi:hypothetical protein
MSGRGLCDEPITRPEESYRLCVCLIVCDLETSTVRRRQPRPEFGPCATGKKVTQKGRIFLLFRYIAVFRVSSQKQNKKYQQQL